MILTCPACGATASAPAWEIDMDARTTLQALIQLPRPVAKQALSYLGLFRPAKRALSWRKAGKIINDLAVLVNTGYVEVQGKPARPCPPHLWGQGMEQMAGRTDLDRPMANHNYLKKIVWQLADQADAGVESRRRVAETDGSRRAESRTGEEEMSEVARRYLEKFGDPLIRGGEHESE
jgi:hypothetical protein